MLHEPTRQYMCYIQDGLFEQKDLKRTVSEGFNFLYLDKGRHKERLEN